MDSTPLRSATFTAILVVFAVASPGAPAYGASASRGGLPVVTRSGADLIAGGQRFRVWGFNYGVGDRSPLLAYFDQPTKQRFRPVVADMREARSLGANSLRVYLELGTFMSGPREPNRRALESLTAVLRAAERVGVYLDLTGNLVWRPAPAWYDALPEQARWRVQARFWRAVARTAATSSAVLVYELTSEPLIDESDGWYTGNLGGYNFVQRIVRHPAGRDRSALARSWMRLLRDAIRARDRRHLIGLGMLADVSGPFGAANVAHLLDVLLVHEYPADGEANEAVAVVRGYAAQGKPVVVGETAPLWSGPRTWRAFLCRSSRYVDGYLSFYDGRTPSQVGTSASDVWYAGMLAQFLRLHGRLSG